MHPLRCRRVATHARDGALDRRRVAIMGRNRKNTRSGPAHERSGKERVRCTLRNLQRGRMRDGHESLIVAEADGHASDTAARHIRDEEVAGCRLHVVVAHRRSRPVPRWSDDDRPERHHPCGFFRT